MYANTLRYHRLGATVDLWLARYDVLVTSLSVPDMGTNKTTLT